MPLEFESMDDVLKSEDVQKAIEEQVQRESDRKVNNVIEGKNKEIGNLAAELKKEQEKNMPAEELAKKRVEEEQKRFEEARQQEAEKLKALQNENLRYFTESQLANAGLPISEELVNSYIAMGNKDTITTAIATQKNVLDQQLDELSKQSAQAGRPKESLAPTVGQKIEQVSFGNVNDLI